MARRISSPILVGRGAELRAFDSALLMARDGRGSIIILSGEAGTGKSRLVGEFAALTREAGGVAVVGSATPPTGAGKAPFAALTPVLRGLLRAIDARLIDPLLGTARRDLAALLPELGTPNLADEPEPFTEARLSEGVLKAIEVVARHRSLLLVAFEDLQWADDATRRIVTFVGRNLVEVPALLLLTYRSDALHEDDGLLGLVSELGRISEAELELGPLTAEEVAEQVRAILGADPERELIRAVVRRSSGNPFFVEELLGAVLDGATDRPPPSVRAMTEARMARLGSEAREVVELVAVAGRDAPSDLVAIASGMPAATFDRAVRDARDAGLLVAMADEPAPLAPAERIERIDMRHELVREVLSLSLTSPRRRDLHGRLAGAIQRHPFLAGTTRLEQQALLARHLLSAGQVAMGVRALLDEARAAEQVSAFVTAHHAYRRALDALALHGQEPELADVDRRVVLEDAAQAASLSGHAMDAVVLAEQALAADGATDDAEGDVRLRLHLGTYQAAAGLLDAARSTLEVALRDAPVGTGLHVRCGTALARLLVASGLDGEATALAAAAAAEAEGLAARREAVQARSVQAMALARAGRADEAHDVLGAASLLEAERQRTSHDSRPSRFIAAIDAFLDRALALEQAGDPRAAARAAREGQAEASRLGLSSDAASVMAAVAARDLLRVGAWGEAEALVRAPDDGAPEPPEPAIVRALLASRRGDRSTAEAGLAAWHALAGRSTRIGWRAFGDYVKGEDAWRRRLYGAARDAVEVAVQVAEREADRMVLSDAAVLGIRVEADARASAQRPAVGDLEAALEIATGHWVRLRATLERAHAGAFSTAWDAAVLATADAELRRISGDSSVSDWEAVAEAWTRAGDPFGVASANLRLGQALLVELGDRDRAGEILRQALSVAEELGAEPLAFEIEQIARRARLVVMREDRGPGLIDPSPGRAEARRLGLSEREIEVLALVAEGLPDREIAERLFISTKTAGHHVSHVLAKLDVSRRGEAAAVAYRIGLVAVEG